jgi:predicted dehydrogenase
MTTPLRVAVVGSGIGRAHVLAYASLPEQFQVVALCDLDEPRARELATHLDIPRVVNDLAQVCKMDEVDVVDLCTPSFLHYEQTWQALESHKHVICEKPVGGSLKQADELIAAEARSGKRVMPIFQYRFGHGLQKLKYLVEHGIAGRAYLTTIETAWRRRAAYYAVPWRGKWQTELGGPLVTLAIHAHDALTYILGPVKNVFARTTTLVNPIETEDCLAASVVMHDGSLASLAVTTGSSHEISRHRFCFSNLTAESHTLPYSNTSDPWTFTGDSSEIEEQIREILKDIKLLPEGYAGQFLRFHQALANNTPLPVSLADARASLELITALYHSTRIGHPTDLPLDSNHPRYANWQ